MLLFSYYKLALLFNIFYVFILWDKLFLTLILSHYVYYKSFIHIRKNIPSAVNVR